MKNPDTSPVPLIKFAGRMDGMSPSAIREILKAPDHPDLISFAAGSPSPETFPDLSALAAEIFRDDVASALQYGITEGYTPLREGVAARMRTKYNTGGDGDTVLITSGGQQVIELTAKVLVNEGDVVLCEDPSFIGGLGALRSFKPQLVGVASDAHGIIPDALEDALKTHPNAKLLYVIPAFQNPTGTLLPLDRRQKLLDLARKYDIVVLEDSPYFELQYDGDVFPTLKSMDTDGRVIFAGSFSKIIAPGIRVGFAVAPNTVAAKMTVAKQVSDVHTNLFFQMLVDRAMRTRDLDAHILDCRNLYRTKRDAMLAALDQHCAEYFDWSTPHGGLFLWLETKNRADSLPITARAKEKLLMTVPGAAFAVTEGAISPGIRLNFSLPSVPQIQAGIIRLAQAAGDVQ